MLGNSPPCDALSGILATFAWIVDQDKKADASTKPRVVVATLAERETFSRLLKELFRSGSGLLVDATECGEEVETDGDPATDHPELVAAVQQVLDAHNARHPDDELTIESDDGIFAIRGAHDLEAANTGQRALRQILTALFSRDLHGSTLVGLVWADDSLDEGVTKDVWSLLMRSESLLGLPNGSTLVLVAGDTNIRPSIHCTGDVSIQFNVHEAGVEERRSHLACGYAVEELGRFTPDDAPLVVLFLGAGAATGLGLPLGNDLRNKALARQVHLPTVDWSNFALAGSMFFERLKVGEALLKGEEAKGVDAFVASLTLERVLHAEQKDENRKDSRTIREFRKEHDSVIATLAEGQQRGDFEGDGLVRILQAQHRLVLVTVNFDRTIEAKAPGLVQPFVTEDQLATFSQYVADYRRDGGPVPLLKLHGDIGVANSIVANVGETAAGLSKARTEALMWLIQEVSSQVLSPWWYVGYSMRDLDLASTWQNVSFARRMVERWVAPFVDPSVHAFIDQYREGLWSIEHHDYNALERTITLTADDFFELFADRVIPRWDAAT